MLSLWYMDLITNLKQLKVSYNIYALSYFIISVYEYCQAFSKLELEKANSLENIKLAAKDIKNYMSYDYNENINSFKYIRDNLSHGYTNSIIINKSIVLLSDVMFQEILCKIFDTNFMTIFRDMLESITATDNKDTFNEYRQQYGFTDNVEWEKEYLRLKQLFDTTNATELAEYIDKYLL